MSGKQPYYTNNWQKYKDADDDFFLPHTLEEVMAAKSGDPELPSSVCCILREYNKKTGKIKERTYQRIGAATERIIKLTDDPNFSFVYVDHAKQAWKAD